jgi:hypothetical protein
LIAAARYLHDNPNNIKSVNIDAYGAGGSVPLLDDLKPAVDWARYRRPGDHHRRRERHVPIGDPS